MAAQTIAITALDQSPAAITLAADTTCLHVSGITGGTGIDLTASPDGVLPYVPITQLREPGQYLLSPGVYSLQLKAGWRLKAAAAGLSPVTTATIAVE